MTMSTTRDVSRPELMTTCPFSFVQHIVLRKGGNIVSRSLTSDLNDDITRSRILIGSNKGIRWLLLG